VDSARRSWWCHDDDDAGRSQNIKKERERKIESDIVEELEGITIPESNVHGRWPVDQCFQDFFGGAVSFARNAFHAVRVACGNT
jgi:hypothetical protein